MPPANGLPPDRSPNIVLTKKETVKQIQEQGGNLKSSSGSMFPWNPPWPPIPPIESPGNRPDFNIFCGIGIPKVPKYLQQTHKCQTVVVFPHLQESHMLRTPGEDLPWDASQLKQTNLLKLLGSVWIVLVRIRMIFLSKLIVCLLYLLLTGIPDQGA